MRGFLALLGLLVAVAWADSARAQGAAIEASVDRTTVSVDGQIVLALTVSGGMRSLPAPQLPALENDWTVYSAGTSRNFSFVNGQISSSASFRYILQPKRVGTFTIGKATVRIGDTTHETTPITVQVTAGGAGPAPGGGRAAPGGAASGAQAEPPADGGSSYGGGDLFVTLSTDRKEAFVQEQILMTFRFYSRVALLEGADYEKPTLTNFWIEDLPPPRNFSEVVNGRRYNVSEIKMALFPTAAGNQVIGPAKLVCTIPEVRRNVGGNDPFSVFGRSVFGSRKITLQTDPVTIRVKPLPEGAPPQFNGAVGRYRLAASVDRTSVAQGEPITLTVRIEGTGNLKTVPDVPLPAMPEFKAYDSSSSSDVDASGGAVKGQKTSQVVLVPLKAGQLTVPPLTMAWFDPQAGAYRTESSAAVPVTVTPGATTAGGAAGGGGRGAIEVVGQDIRYLKTELGRVSAAGRRPWDGALFWLFQLLPVGLMVTALVHERHRRRLTDDVGFARQVRSGREATRRLKRANDLAAANDDGLFAELSAALLGYVADRSNRAAAGLTHDELRRLLAAKRIPGEVAGRLVAFLESCDMARFAPAAAGASDRRRLLDEAAALIEELKRRGM
jgi:hypothetical protein